MTNTKPTGEEQLKELFYRAGLPHPNQDETSAQLLNEIVRWHNDLILQEKREVVERVNRCIDGAGDDWVEKWPHSFLEQLRRLLAELSDEEVEG